MTLGSIIDLIGLLMKRGSVTHAMGPNWSSLGWPEIITRHRAWNRRILAAADGYGAPW